ncbi:hypothetical protein GH733_015110, partial [Mirounga leonina]
MRVLTSYWVGKDSMYKSFEVILIDPFHKTFRRKPDTQWITKPVYKHREMSCGLGKGHKFTTLLVVLTMQHREDTILSNSTISA